MINKNCYSALEIMTDMSNSFDEMKESVESILDKEDIILNGIEKLEEWNQVFEETSGKIEEKYSVRLNEIDSSLETIAYQITNEKNGNDNIDLQNALNNHNVIMIDRNINITKTITITDRDYIKIYCLDNIFINHTNITLFKFERVKNIEIINCNIKGDYISGNTYNSQFCIDIKGYLDSPVLNVLIKDNKIYNQGKGFSLYRINNYNCENNYFENIYGGAIYDQFCKGSNVLKNKYIGRANPNNDVLIDDNGGSLLLSSRSENVKFTENIVINSIGNGAKAEGCKNVIFNNNIIDTFGKDGLKVMHCTHYDSIYNKTENFQICNNIFINGKRWRDELGGCINVDGAIDGVISGNVIKGDGVSEKYGVYFNSWKYDNSPEITENRNIKIVDNIISGCGIWSVLFASSSLGHWDITFTNNTVDNMCRFISCRSTLVIDKNKIVLPVASTNNYALEILGAGVLKLDSNTILNGKTHCIYLQDIIKARVLNNEIRIDETLKNTIGLYFRNSNDIIIKNNRFENCYKPITSSCENANRIEVIENIFTNALDNILTLSNHSNIITTLLNTVNISKNVINGYYTEFSSGLSLLRFALSGYEIKNLIFSENIIDKYVNCLKNVYPQNVITADIKKINNLILGKNLLNDEIVTLAELVVTNKF